MIGRDIVKNMDIDSFRIYMMNESNLNDIKTVVTEGVNPRIIMICYMIYYFNNEIFNNKDRILELLLMYQSDNIINLFEKKSRELAKEYNVFIRNFKKWKRLDAEIMTAQMTESIKELDIYQNLKLTDKQLSDIETKKSFINNRLEILKKHYSITDIVNIDNNMLENTIKRAFSQLLTETLKRFETNELTERDINWFIEILDEIKNELNKLTPNNKKFIQITNDSLDSEIIKQLLENNAFDRNYLIQLMKFIISRIKELQAPIDDSKNKEWSDNIIVLLEKYNARFYEVLPIFFEDIHLKIERIRMQLLELNKIEKSIK